MRIMNDQRKRFKTNETAQIEVYGQAGVIMAEMGNLSLTGAFLKLVQHEFLPKKGDLVNITVHLTSLNRVHNVDAEVVWTENLGLGICFINKEDVLERMLAKASAF